MSIYDNGRALAIRQLAPIAQGGKGQVVTLKFTAPGVYDTETATTSSPTPVSLSCSGVEGRYSSDQFDGERIVSGDAPFTLSPVTTDGSDLDLPDVLPAGAVLILASGVTKRVVSIDLTRPSGLLIKVVAQLRGAG